MGLAVESREQGGRIYSAADDGRIWVHSPSGVLLGSVDVGAVEVAAIRVGPRTGTVFAVTTDGAVHELDVPSRLAEFRSLATFRVGGGSIVDIELDPTERFILAATFGTPPVAPGLWETRLDAHSQAIRDVAFSPDGQLVATAGLDGLVLLWTAAGHFDGRLVGHTGGVYDVQFDSTGAYLASASSDGTVRVWDTASRDIARIFEGHDGPVYGVAFKDSDTLASAGRDGRIGLWSLGSEEPLALLDAHDAAVNAVAFSPGGTLLASAGDDLSVRVWDAGSLEPLAELIGHRDSVSDVAFGPDGRLASGGFDQRVLVWERAGDGTWLPDAQVVGTHFGRVFEVDWIDAVRLAVATGDERPGTTVWRVSGDDESRLAEIPQPGRVYGIAAAPDGAVLASGGGSSDGRVVPHVSPLDDAALVAAAEQRIGRAPTGIECNRYELDCAAD